MKTYKYKPYYEYNGPSRASPLREELSLDDQERNIAFFYTDVEEYFEDDITASVSKEHDGTLVVTTLLEKKECDDIIAKILNNLDLFARRKL